MRYRSRTDIQAVKDSTEKRSEKYADAFDNFTEKYWNLNHKDQSLISIIISSHLFVETMVNDILEVIFKDTTEIKKYTFHKKIQLLKATGIWHAKDFDNILALNRVRNNFAHNLEYSPSYEEIKKICPYLTTDEWKNQSIAIRNSASYVCGKCGAYLSIAESLKEHEVIIL